MKLRLKQQRFADEYIVSGNAREAAILAGYSKKTASETGYENLNKPHIREYIDKRLEDLQSEKVADQQEILEFLSSIVRGEKTEEVLRGTGKGAQTIDEMDISASDRIKAAELIGKRHAMWTDKAEITQRVIEINVGEYDDND